MAIAVGASLHSRTSIPMSLVNLSGGLVASLLLGLLVAVTFRYSSTLLRRLGDTGRVVFMRLMAFILLCVGGRDCVGRSAGLAGGAGPWRGGCPVKALLQCSMSKPLKCPVCL